MGDIKRCGDRRNWANNDWELHKNSIDFDPEIPPSSAFNLTKIMRKVYFLGIITVGLILTGRADIIPTLSPVTPNGGNFTWSYAANVTVDETINTGDYFTIYDFGTFVAASNLQPAGWTFSSSLLGVTPSQVSPTDNPNLLNLTWTYTGTTPLVGAAALGNFSVLAATNLLTTSDFAAEATRSTGPNAGSKIDNIGRTSVPVPEMSALLPILSVCGAGLVAAIPSLLRRRKG
jgi:hypothetical protein